MKRFVPDSIAGRTILVLVLGLTISHVLSMALYVTDRGSALVNAGEEHVGERIAMIVQLVENTPDSERQRILGYVTSPTLGVELSVERKVPQNAEKGWRQNVLRKALQAHLKKIGGAEFAIRHTALRTHKISADALQDLNDDAPTVLASVRLRDGRWLNFAAVVEASEPFWSVRFILSMLVMIGAVVALAALVVRYMVGPLSVFSAASERLGVDLHAPSLAETGPREVRRATRAFNEMQERIRKLIDDRTRMLAAISHDLRTPITRLRLRSEFIEEDEQHEKALRDLDEMETMIASLLSFARDDAHEEPREIVDLSSLLHSVCDDLSDTGNAVTFDNDDRFPYFCSRLALKRAFTNLLQNAVRYGERARVTLNKTPDQIVVQIDDDGPGIPDAEQEKAFDPFYRLEHSRSRETGGAGVGLHVARTIIRAHGGDVVLGNRQDGGLRVVVTLPC